MYMSYVLDYKEKQMEGKISHCLFSIGHSHDTNDCVDEPIDHEPLAAETAWVTTPNAVTLNRRLAFNTFSEEAFHNS